MNATWIRWFKESCCGVLERTERLRVCKARHYLAIVERNIVSEEACIFLLKRWSNLVPVLFCSLYCGSVLKEAEACQRIVLECYLYSACLTFSANWTFSPEPFCRTEHIGPINLSRLSRRKAGKYRKSACESSFPDFRITLVIHDTGSWSLPSLSRTAFVAMIFWEERFTCQSKLPLQSDQISNSYFWPRTRRFGLQLLLNWWACFYFLSGSTLMGYSRVPINSEG